MQDVPDQKQIVSQYCRFVGEIKTGRNVKQMVARALQLATSHPQGPAYLMGAREVMEETIEPYNIDMSFWQPLGPSALPENAVVDIANTLIEASEPLVVTGYSGRNHKAVEALVSLADTVKGLRVVDTGGSDMCFPADHPGWLGTRYGGDDSITTADVILVLDCDVPWVNTQRKPKSSAKIIHLDVDPLKQSMLVYYINAQQRYKVDAETAIRQIVSYLQTARSEQLSTSKFDDRWKALQVAHQQHLDEIEGRAKASEKLTSDYVCSAVRKALPEDTIFAVEAVTNTSMAADQIQAKLPGQWLHCGGGGLGWSGGGALGIKLAADAIDGNLRKRFVVQIVGDGSFMFSVPSSVYWIANRYNIPILTIVLNNEGWNAPRRSLLLVHPDGQASKVTREELNISFRPSPNYSGIAREATDGAIFGARVSSPEELASALAKAVESLEKGVSAVLDVAV